MLTVYSISLHWVPWVKIFSVKWSEFEHFMSWESDKVWISRGVRNRMRRVVGGLLFLHSLSLSAGESCFTNLEGKQRLRLTQMVKCPPVRLKEIGRISIHKGRDSLVHLSDAWCRISERIIQRMWPMLCWAISTFLQPWSGPGAVTRNLTLMWFRPLKRLWFMPSCLRGCTDNCKSPDILATPTFSMGTPLAIDLCWAYVTREHLGILLTQG